MEELERTPLAAENPAQEATVEEIVPTGNPGFEELPPVVVPMGVLVYL